MDAQEKRLTEWLKRNAWNGEERLTAIVVKHVGVGGKVGADVATFEAGSEFDDDAIESVVSDIGGACEGDASGLGGGLQRYLVLPRYGDKERSRGRFILRVIVRDDEETDTLMDSEPPNKAGITTQLMRHVEAKERVMMASLGQMMGIQQRTIQRQSEQLEAIMTKQMDMIATMEELAQAKHEREIETKREEGRAAAQAVLLEEATNIIPIVKAKLLGSATGLKQTPSEEMVEKLFTTLTEEQMNVLIGTFRPDQQALLFEIYQRIKTQAEAREKGAKK